MIIILFFFLPDQLVDVGQTHEYIISKYTIEAQADIIIDFA